MPIYLKRQFHILTILMVPLLRKCKYGTLQSLACPFLFPSSHRLLSTLFSLSVWYVNTLKSQGAGKSEANSSANISRLRNKRKHRTRPSSKSFRLTIREIQALLVTLLSLTKMKAITPSTRMSISTAAAQQQLTNPQLSSTKRWPNNRTSILLSKNLGIRKVCILPWLLRMIIC